MDTPDRGARMLVYFIAIALMGCGLMDLSLHWVEEFASGRRFMRGRPCGLYDFVFPAIFFVLGIVVLIKASSIAEWISNRFDE